MNPPIALPTPSPRAMIAGTLALALLAYLGNILNVPLFFGVTFVFGSIMAMLAIALLGPLPGLLVGIAGGAYTVVLFGHPYALVIFSIEALAVGLLYRRGMKNLVLADLAYWLVLGAPLVLLLYTGVLGMDRTTATLIALKQALNGLFNALLAGLILLGLRLAWRGALRLTLPVPKLADLLFHVLLTAILLAGAIPIVHQGQSQRAQAEGFLAGDLRHTAQSLANALEARPDADATLQRALLGEEHTAPGMNLALLYDDGRVLASRGKLGSTTKPGKTQALGEGLAIWLPAGDMPIMKRWKQGYYQYRLPVSGLAAEVLVEQPAAPLIGQLEQGHLTLLGLLAGLVLIGIAAALALSRWLTGPLRALETASSGLTAQIAEGVHPTFTHSPVQEYDNLNQTLRDMSTRLADNFHELHRIQAGLQDQVQAQTTELQESEWQLRYMLETAPIAARIARRGGHEVVFSNARYAELIHAETIGATGVDPAAYYAKPEDYADILARLGRGERIVDRLVELTIPGQGRKWALASYLPIQYQGEAAVLGWFYDITELKQAEQAAREGKQLLDSIVENIPTMIFMKRADDLSFALLNKAGEELIGYPRETLLGKNDYDFFPKEQADFFTAKDREVLEIGYEDIPEETIDTRSLGKRILHTRKIALRDEQGRPQYLLGISHDITERKQAEEALQASREQLTEAQRIAAIGSWSLRLADNKLEWSDEIFHIFEIDPARFGASYEAFVDTIHPDDREWVHKVYTDSVANRQPYHIVHRLLMPDGRIKYVEERCETLYAEDGTPTVSRGTVQDVTERKRMERVKDEFISTVSHELRTPLTSISGALGLINSGVLGALPEQAAPMIDIAHKNSQRLTHLINDLLDMEKISAGKMHFDMRALNLLPLLRQSIEANRAYGAERRIDLALDCPEADIEVRVDGHRLMQVMSNLLSNAIKYSPDGGKVDILVARDDRQVTVSVRDRGPGIPAEFRDRIFGKFSQADSSDTRQKGGTGLGLAITKQLVEHMGGRIGFDSEPGQGTRFYFELPLHRGMTEGMQPGAERILVVEDEPDIARLLRLMLEQAGYTVDTVHNGAEALATIEQKHYAAMTLDLMLPDISGLDIIQRLRAQPRTANLPIVVVSAKIEEGRLALNGQFTGIEWLAKPIEETRLIEAIKHLTAEFGTRRPRILHVEDDTDLHTVIRTMAGDDFDFGLATTMTEARRRIESEPYDLIILDLALPDGSGWELLPDIRTRLPEARIVVLSGNDVGKQHARMVESVLMKSRISQQQLLDVLTQCIKTGKASQ